MKRMLTRIGCILAGMAVFAPAPAQQATGTLFSGCGSLDAERRLELPFVAPLAAGHTVIVAVAAFLPGTMEPPAVRTWQRPGVAPQLLAPINRLTVRYAANPQRGGSRPVTPAPLLRQFNTALPPTLARGFTCFRSAISQKPTPTA